MLFVLPTCCAQQHLVNAALLVTSSFAHKNVLDAAPGAPHSKDHFTDSGTALLRLCAMLAFQALLFLLQCLAAISGHFRLFGFRLRFSCHCHTAFSACSPVQSAHNSPMQHDKTDYVALTCNMCSSSECKGVCCVVHVACNFHVIIMTCVCSAVHM